MAEPGQEQNVVFSIEKIYIKDVSFEAPGVPLVFSQTQNVSTDIGIQLSLENNTLSREQGLYEVSLIITATAKQESKVIFLVELTQSGLFHFSGLDDDRLEHALEISCPKVLLPFAREAINDFVEKGGFPQLLINQVNFNALYEQKKQAKTGKARAENPD